MVCYLIAPNHYLNQYLIISEFFGFLLRVISQEMLKISILFMSLRITNLISKHHLPEVSEFTNLWQRTRVCISKLIHNLVQQWFFFFMSTHHFNKWFSEVFPRMQMFCQKNTFENANCWQFLLDHNGLSTLRPILNGHHFCWRHF